MEQACNVSADLDTHPGAPVVINPVGAVVGISGSEGIADHGVPFFVEIAPLLAVMIGLIVLIGPAKSNQNWTHSAFGLRERTIRARHHHRYAIEMIDHHLIGQKFAVEEPERK